MLDGKVAIVTGAAHLAGIGFAAARTFAASGAHVVIVDHDLGDCEQAAASISAEVPAKGLPRAIGMAECTPNLRAS